MAKRGSSAPKRHKNIDLFAGKFRLRVMTPEGQMGGTFATLDEALVVRHEIRLFYSERASRMRTKRLSHKRSRLPVGVSYADKASKRDLSRVYRVYQASWVDETGVGRVRTFQAGRVGAAAPEDVQRAKETAIAFRAAYEFATVNGMRFHPEYFNQWKSIDCFPFKPPAVPEPVVSQGDSIPAPLVEELALPHTPSPEQVAELRRLVAGMEDFRATLLIAKFGTARAARRFLKAEPEEQERLWPPAKVA